MCSSKEYRLAQIILLIALAVIGIGNLAYTVNSQTCDVPRYEHRPIHVTSWSPSTQVSVQIDSAFSGEEKAGIEAGNRSWNNPLLACSGVTFSNFDPIVM